MAASPEDKINRMAEVMRDRASAFGACTDDDLRAEGFGDAEIKLYSPAARKCLADGSRARADARVQKRMLRTVIARPYQGSGI